MLEEPSTLEYESQRTSAAAQRPGTIRIVIADDHPIFRDGLRKLLSLEDDFDVVGEARDGNEVLEIVRQGEPDVLLLDLRMLNMGGLEMLEQLPRIDPRIVPIIITGYGTVDSAVESMKIGAFDFLSKPFEVQKLVQIIRQRLDRK